LNDRRAHRRAAKDDIAMTTIDRNQTAPVRDPAAARALMQFSPEPPRMGVEMEFHIIDLRRPGNAHVATDERVRALKSALREKHGLMVDEEIAAHMVEIKTPAYTLGEIGGLLADIARAQAALAAEANLLALKAVPTGNLPGLDLAQARANMIGPLEDDPQRGARARMMMTGIRNAQLEGMTAYPLENVSAQVSIGAKDPDHLFAMVRRHNMLLPFLFTLFHNRTPSFDAQGRKTGIHGGIAARQTIGHRGLIGSAFMRAGNGEQFLKNYLEDVYRRPMIAYIDARGDFTAAARGQVVTLETLREQGLATQANAQLSQSMDWTSAKVKTIPGTPYMRAEMRDMDSGGHHAASLAIINGLMNMDPDCGRSVDSLLAGYGYSGAGLCYTNKIMEDMDRSLRQADKGMNRRYGDGFMDRFAQDFYFTLAPYIRKYGLEADAAPLRHACETGMSEALALDRIIRTPQDADRFVRTYKQDLLANPRTSLALTLA
jgi:hypothetical protein